MAPKEVRERFAPGPRMQTCAPLEIRIGQEGSELNRTSHVMWPRLNSDETLLEAGVEAKSSLLFSARKLHAYTIIVIVGVRELCEKSAL